jgi:4-hydroxyacetophenone monooxygenase
MLVSLIPTDRSVVPLSEEKPMNETSELRTATDATIEDAVQYADPIVLRGLLYQLTGDEELAKTSVESVSFGFLTTNVVLDEGDIELLRTKAADYLKALRDSGVDAADPGPESRLAQSVSLAVGYDLPEHELGLWIESLALDPWGRGMVWESKPPVEKVADFSTIVIGAGMGGLNAAVHLKREGISFTVLEKDGGVGGTWNQNRYPGARVDTPSRGYVHLFGVDYQHTNPFCARESNEIYFNWVADHFGVREDIQFHTEVTAADWDEADQLWVVTVTGPDGIRTLRANAVISAVGFLSRKNQPVLEGIEDFVGQAFHTSEWPTDTDLTGKRVAVIGSGASGYQLVPELAKQADHTYLVQRQPNWCFAVDGYLAPYPDQVAWLDRNFPLHTNFMRLAAAHLYGPANLSAAYTADPDFVDEFAVSELNKTVRDGAVDFIKTKLASRPELIDAMIPAGPPMSGRPILIDSGYSIFDALLRDDVTLVQGGIARVHPHGIEDETGTIHPVDVIVYATGFRANDFLWPMQITGRDGANLEQLWAKDGGRGYLGVMLPGFPNLFTIYGPNTSPTGGLNVVDMEELQLRFALECIRGLVEADARTVEVSHDGFVRYNEEIDRSEVTRIYLDKRVKNYYTNDFGRSAVNCPLDGRVMWDLLRSPVRARPEVRTHADVRPHFGADLVVT